MPVIDASLLKGDKGPPLSCDSTSPGPALAVQGAIRVPDFPETCTNGVLDLQGLYAIKHRTATLNGDGSCRVLGTGATILLSAPLTFPGDSAHL